MSALSIGIALPSFWTGMMMILLSRHVGRSSRFRPRCGGQFIGCIFRQAVGAYMVLPTVT